MIRPKFLGRFFIFFGGPAAHAFGCEFDFKEGYHARFQSVYADHEGNPG
jgi:hypothetical protein